MRKFLWLALCLILAPVAAVISQTPVIGIPSVFQSITIGGNTMHSVPYIAWGGFAGSQSFSATNTDIGTNSWIPTAAINITRLDVHQSAPGSGCTTFPVLGIYDVTAAAFVGTITLGSTFYVYSAQTAPVPAGHTIRLGVQTAAAGCTITGDQLAWTIEYTMQ